MVRYPEDDYPYPIPDGYECDDCGGSFKYDQCQECGNDPFGGPVDDEWVSGLYEAAVREGERRRQIERDWVTDQLTG